MHTKGILNVPDFIANAGGVICASVEYHGGTQGWLEGRGDNGVEMSDPIYCLLHQVCAVRPPSP